jgi:hypothetical protein
MSFKCPSCSAEKPQQINEVYRKQALSGRPVTLPLQYQPPKQPWAYLQGFLLGVPANTAIMFSMVTPDAPESTTGLADLFGTVAFLSIWGGYGVWKNRAYKQKYDEWNKTTARMFFCQECSHAFDK